MAATSKLSELEGNRVGSSSRCLCGHGFKDLGDYSRGASDLRETSQKPIRFGAELLHAGTTISKAGEVVNAGGRVLGVTAMGDTIADAKRAAYEAVDKISWQGGWCRRDISDKAQ